MRPVIALEGAGERARGPAAARFGIAVVAVVGGRDGDRHDADSVGDDVTLGVAGEADPQRAAGDVDGVQVAPGHGIGGVLAGRSALIDVDRGAAVGAIIDGVNDVGGTVGGAGPGREDAVVADGQAGDGPDDVVAGSAVVDREVAAQEAAGDPALAGPGL